MVIPLLANQDDTELRNEWIVFLLVSRKAKVINHDLYLANPGQDCEDYCRLKSKFITFYHCNGLIF